MKGHKKLIATLGTVMLVVVGLMVPALPAFAATGTVLINGAASTSVAAGANSYITVTGTGYTSGTSETVELLNASNIAVYSTVVTAVTGPPSFSLVVPVYNLPRGTYTATTVAGADTTGVWATVGVTPGALTLSAISVQGGQTVYVSGTGFNASVNVTIYVNSQQVGTTTTQTTGSFASFPINIPTSLPGGTSNYIWGNDGYGASPVTYISIAPKLTLSTASVASGSAIAVSGSAFAQNSTVYFYLDGSSTSIPSVGTTDSNGALTNTSVTIPPTYGGSHSIKAQDASGNSDSANFNVTSKSTIAPATGPAGTNVSVTGTGFLASTPITITYNGASISTTTSDTNGNVTGTFKTPAGPSNTNTVTVSDGTNSNTANFTSTATGSINPAKGNTGSAVQITGAGFMASHTVTVMYNNATAGSATSDNNGNFTANITVPNASSGDHTMTFSDGTNSVTATFSITSNATMSPLTGFVGTNITVQGTGFTALRGVSVKYDGTDVISPAPTTDANGSLAASFKAPASKGGNHTVIISDGSSTMTFTYVIDSTPPTVPAPQLPISNTQADAIPSLKWSDVTDQNVPVTYNLQLSSDAAFANLIINRTGLTVSSYTLTAAESLPNRSKQAPYYWRVQAVDGASNVSSWASPSTFFVGFVLQTWALYVIFAVVAIVLAVLGFWLGKRRAMSM